VNKNVAPLFLQKTMFCYLVAVLLRFDARSSCCKALLSGHSLNSFQAFSQPGFHVLPNRL